MENAVGGGCQRLSALCNEVRLTPQRMAACRCERAPLRTNMTAQAIGSAGVVGAGGGRSGVAGTGGSAC